MLKKKRPSTFTSREEVIEHLSNRILSDGRSYKVIADGVGVSETTISKIASRYTGWPRPKTLWGILNFFDIKFRLED